MLLTLLSLSGCATVQTCEPLTDPVKPPALPPLVWAAPERDWQGQMQDFLQGTLPTQADSRPSSPAAQPLTTRP